MEQTISNYSLLRLLGRGGMGSVYEARHTTIERRAAIKILHKEFCEDPDVIKRFMNEARAVNIIGHPGLVSVSEFGQTADGAPYIVMEYIDGITLREHLQRAGGRLPAEQVVRLSRQIASTLAAAHGKQIVHRDLKPVNIMLVSEDPDGEGGAPDRVKILDFGIAKLATETASQTKSGILMGTPTYMSPEQCRSGRSAVDRSDVYALGVIMYELLAGEPPFRGGPAVLMAAHLMQEPAPLSGRAPGTPSELCALIHRMLAKNPSDRPTAAEVARSLAPQSGPLSPPPSLLLSAEPAASAGPPLSDQATLLRAASPPAAAPRSAAPLPLSGKLLGLAALLVLLLGLGVGLLALRLSRPRGPSPAAGPPDRAAAPRTEAAPPSEPARRAADADSRPPASGTASGAAGPVAAARSTESPSGPSPGPGPGPSPSPSPSKIKIKIKGHAKSGQSATRKAAPRRSSR